MGSESKIQWTNSTWNPWHGCHKVSPGCKFCYMYRDKERYGLDPTVVVRSAEKTFMAPKAWKEPRLVFTCSWSDFFIEEADQWRDEAWRVIRNTSQNHTYQILTKRPERIMECLPPDWGYGYDNVWLGVSAEDQKMYDLRVPILVNIPAKTRFVSIEPMLEPINIGHDRMWEYYSYKNIHWVILGGESGNDSGPYGYRRCEIDWFYDIVKDLSDYPTCIFVKQLGTHLATLLMLKDKHGGDMEEWPEHLRVRQFPTLKY